MIVLPILVSSLLIHGIQSSVFQLGSEAMVSPSLVASLVGRGADTSFPSQLDAVSPSPVVGVSAVALADSSFPSQLDLVSLSPVVEVSAVAPADSVSWEPQLTPVSLSSFIAEVPTVTPVGRAHWFHRWDVSSSSSIPASSLHHSSIGKPEADRPKVFPASGSDAVWRMSLPSASRLWRLNLIGLLILIGSLCSPLWMMLPRFAGGGGVGAGDFNFRVPPAWAPENEHHYSFRAWCQDLQLWLMLTDLQPAQQAAAIVMRLGGAARELVRSITPDEIMNGGIVNGMPVDPVTYIVAGLQNRFALLDDEHCLAAMTQLLAFSRRHGESIKGTLARYEVVRQRAAREGHFVMSWEGCALQILRACNVSSQHMIQFLQPFQGRLPQDEAEFAVLSSHMRRIGHILEHSPNNLGQLLHGNRPATAGEYYSDTAQGYLRTATEYPSENPFSLGRCSRKQLRLGYVASRHHSWRRRWLGRFDQSKCFSRIPSG